jgi:hypothetical protein
MILNHYQSSGRPDVSLRFPAVSEIGAWAICHGLRRSGSRKIYSLKFVTYGFVGLEESPSCLKTRFVEAMVLIVNVSGCRYNDVVPADAGIEVSTLSDAFGGVKQHLMRRARMVSDVANLHMLNLVIDFW